MYFFAYSSEFKQLLEGTFDSALVRPEVDMVVDYYQNSAESTARNRDNTGYVEDRYDTIIPRGPQTEDFDFWLGSHRQWHDHPAAVARSGPERS